MLRGILRKFYRPDATASQHFAERLPLNLYRTADQERSDQTTRLDAKDRPTHPSAEFPQRSPAAGRHFAATHRAPAVTLQHQHPRRASRRGLEPQRATASESVKTSQAMQTLTEPIEQCLPHPIRRRPQAGCIGKMQYTAAVLATDDAYRIPLPRFFSADLHKFAPAPYFAALSGCPPTITVTIASGLMRARKARRMSSRLTAATLAE